MSDITLHTAGIEGEMTLLWDNSYNLGILFTLLITHEYKEDGNQSAQHRGAAGGAVKMEGIPDGGSIFLVALPPTPCLTTLSLHLREESPCSQLVPKLLVGERGVPHRLGTRLVPS